MDENGEESDEKVLNRAEQQPLPSLAELLERRSTTPEPTVEGPASPTADTLLSQTEPILAAEDLIDPQPHSALPLEKQLPHQPDITPEATSSPAEAQAEADESFQLVSEALQTEEPHLPEAKPEAPPVIRRSTTPDSSPPWKRVGVLAAGGIAGLAAGFYLLTVLGGGLANRDKPAMAADLSGAPHASADDAKIATHNDAMGTGVRQASFEQPTTGSTAADETDRSSRKALWAWIDDSPRFGTEELLVAMQAADEAAATLSQNRLEGPSTGASQDGESDQTSLQRIGVGYAKLCELAQVVSLLDSDASDPGMMLKRLEAKDVYRKLFRSAHVRSDSQLIASRWIAWPGRPHGGVFFSCLPGMAKRAGKGLYQYEVSLADGAAVSVVTPERFRERRFSSAEEVLIIGCVIESPRDRLPGYEGDADRVVWRATSLALKAPSLP